MANHNGEVTNPFTREEFDHILKTTIKNADSTVKSGPVILAATGNSGVPDIKPENAKMDDNPIKVDADDDMDPEDAKKCKFIMQIVMNMVQQTIVDSAKNANIEPAEALKNIDAWIAGLVSFPMPFFNFKSAEDGTYHKEDFDLNVDPTVVENIINIKGVPDLKDAVINTLKSSGGTLYKKSNTKSTYNYFGIINAYTKANGVLIRAIRFSMNMEKTDTKALCVEMHKTNLDSNYTTYVFSSEQQFMVIMYDKTAETTAEFFAKKLQKIIEDFYNQAFDKYKQMVSDILKGKK